MSDRRDPLADPEIEIVLLGALLLDNSRIPAAEAVVSPEDFSDLVLGRVFAALLDAATHGKASPVTIWSRLSHDEGLAQLGGRAFLFKLIDSPAVRLVQSTEAARTVADLAQRRLIRDRFRQLAGHADAGMSTADLIEQADAAVAVADGARRLSRTLGGAEALDEALREAEATAAGEQSAALRIMGYEDFNHLTGGARPGDLIVLAGRPGMGKSAVGLAIATGSASAGGGTAFVSLEMRAQDLALRAAANAVFRYGDSLTFERLRTGNLSLFDRERIATARAALGSMPLILHEDAGLTVPSIARLARRWQRQFEARGTPLRLVAVDYLGLLRSDQPGLRRHEQIGAISRALKELARDLGITILLLAQLNRELERREDKRPQLSDLRDSGEVEQDADAVLFVHRAQYFLERSEPDLSAKEHTDWLADMSRHRDRLELIAAKVRNGRVGRREGWFFGSHQAVRGSDFRLTDF